MLLGIRFIGNTIFMCQMNEKEITKEKNKIKN
jgi:hypothetical protein